MRLDEDATDSSCGLGFTDVFTVNAGERPRPGAFGWSLSTQSAGVGGTGPRFVTPAGGRRLVGGDMMGTTFLSIL